jgi:hypothetical protein
LWFGRPLDARRGWHDRSCIRLRRAVCITHCISSGALAPLPIVDIERVAVFAILAQPLK